MVFDRAFDPLEQRAASQTEARHQFDDRKTAAGFLFRRLRPGLLIGGGVGHGNARPIHHLDVATQPEFRSREARGEFVGQRLMKLPQSCDRQASPCLTIGTRAAVGRLVPGRIPRLDFTDDLAAGTTRTQHLPQERPERQRLRIQALAAVNRPWRWETAARRATTARKSHTTGSTKTAAIARIVRSTHQVENGIAARKGGGKDPVKRCRIKHEPS